MKALRYFKIAIAALMLQSFAPQYASAQSSESGEGLRRVRKFNLASAPKAFQSLRELKVPMNQVTTSLNKLSETKPAEMSAHVGQTLLFLLAVTGIDIVKNELTKQGSQTPTASEIADQILAASNHILNDAGIYLAIIGAGAADVTTRYPIRVLSAWLADPQARPVLAASLRSTMSVLAATGGWDLGAQLKIEASYLLDTPAEFERIQSLFSTAGGALRAMLFANPSAHDDSDLALIEKMGRNLLYVALFDQDLRSQWMDNTLRTRLMTGEFAVLTAAIAAAGIGTLMLPGGGTVTGFIIGVAAVTIAINIPEEIKISITKSLHTVRKNFNHGRLQTNAAEIRSIIHRWSSGFQRPGAKLQQLQAELQRRRHLRSNLLTIDLEKMRMVFRESFSPGTKALLAEQARPRLAGIFLELQDFFKAETQTLALLKASAAKSESSELASYLDSESKRIETLTSFFAQLGQELDVIFVTQAEGRLVFKDVTARAQEFVKFVEVSFSRGFQEDKIL